MVSFLRTSNLLMNAAPTAPAAHNTGLFHCSETFVRGSFTLSSVLSTYWESSRTSSTLDNRNNVWWRVLWYTTKQTTPEIHPVDYIVHCCPTMFVYWKTYSWYWKYFTEDSVVFRILVYLMRSWNINNSPWFLWDPLTPRINQST